MIILIAALDQNNGIGKNGKLPWHIKEDLALFKNMTLNHKIVMGRKTYESIGKPLPNRINFVITRNKDYFINHEVEIINDFSAYLQLNENTDEIIYIIGGAEIYRQALPYAKRLALSFINDEFECDTFFPEFKLEDYKVIENVNFELFKFTLLEKKSV